MAILITAFDAYDQWNENSSWIALTEYLRECGTASDLITRRYPVHLSDVKARLDKDLPRGIEGVLHIGQRPGAGVIQLESICLNIAGSTVSNAKDFGPILKDAPLAFRSSCPLGLWVDQLRREQIAAEVSYHAGTFLCNAIMYLSHHWFATQSRCVPITFLHLPLTQEQSKLTDGFYPAMGVDTMAKAIQIVIELLRKDCRLRMLA